MQTPDLSSDVFSLALHLEEPWYVSHSTISLEENRIDIYIDYHPGKPFKCSKCGEESSHIHDVTERVWRHLNFFPIQVLPPLSNAANLLFKLWRPHCRCSMESKRQRFYPNDGKFHSHVSQ